MKTFKGTKGEWKIDNNYLTTDEINKDNRCPIATIHTMEDGKDNVKRQAEAEANAKLIASAPKLLEALKNVVEGFKLAIRLNGLKGFNNFIEEGNQAINKAI